MTYETFKGTLIAELKGHFPPDTTITVHSIPRNNHIAVEGLTILESGFNLAPTIYIEDYYEKLACGTAFSDVFQEILNTYYRCRPQENINPSFFQDFQFVKQRIVYKLVHYERNRKLLNDIPHIPFLDLAIVFYCLVSSTELGNATILIHNEHLKLWNTDRLALYQLARQNTPFLLSSHMEQLSGLLDQLPSGECGQLPAFPMYILTNKNRYLGASCLLYDDLLPDIAQKLQSDFFIIPSSIHEVILVPACQSMKKDDFDQMIHDVNSTQLEPEEILSDHVYYFSQSVNQIVA